MSFISKADARIAELERELSDKTAIEEDLAHARKIEADQDRIINEWKARAESAEAALRLRWDLRDGPAAAHFAAYPSAGEEKPRVGDDLSYYLGPDAKQASAEQCEELARNVRAAEAAAGKEKAGEG